MSEDPRDGAAPEERRAVAFLIDPPALSVASPRLTWSSSHRANSQS